MALAIPHTSLHLLSLLMSLVRCTIYHVLAARSTASRTKFHFAVFSFERNTRHHIIIQSSTPSPVSLVHITLTLRVVSSVFGAFHITYEILFLSFLIGSPITRVRVTFDVKRCWHDCQKLELTFPPVVYSSVCFFFFNKTTVALKWTSTHASPY